jgi:hypothetical protein
MKAGAIVHANSAVRLVVPIAGPPKSERVSNVGPFAPLHDEARADDSIVSFSALLDSFKSAQSSRVSES